MSGHVGSPLSLSALAIGLAAVLSGCAVPERRVTRVYEDVGPRVALAPAPVFVQYGSVRRIEVIEDSAQPSGAGAVLGGVVGGALGNQIGHGLGRAAATALGVFGGAAVGNEIEQNQAAGNVHRHYQVAVHFDDGSVRHFEYRALNGLRVGDRVRLEHGVLSLA